MLLTQALAMTILALPLSAQAWDFRLEVPSSKGQSLPQTLVNGVATGQKSLDTGSGLILTASHRIIRVGPVLKFEWSVEYSQLQAGGELQQGPATYGSSLKQNGLGVGLNAQFWVPFTGLAAEFGAIERVHAYKLDVAGVSKDQTIARPWLRAGLRWSLPLPVINPYIAASFQQPLTKDHPVQMPSATSLSTYVGAQGAGQEFQRLWTFGVGVTF